MTTEKDKKLNIVLDEQMAQGVYANLAMISHSADEFVLDFIRVVPNTTNAAVKARIIVTPPHARRLLKALGENLERYETSHGPIEDRSVTRVPQFPIDLSSLDTEQ